MTQPSSTLYPGRSTVQRTLRLLAGASGLAILLAACGGGDDGGPVPGAATVQTVPPSGTAAALATSTPSPVSPIGAPVPDAEDRPVAPGDRGVDRSLNTPVPAGLNPVPRIEAALPWSSPATWGGTLPGPGSEVVVPHGRALLLDVDPPPLAGLRIDGALYVADGQTRQLTTGWIMVHGLLQAGLPLQPRVSPLTITLTGTDERENVGGMGMGTKLIGAMAGGRIELHGARRDSVAWTQLASHAAPGDTRITVAGKVDWRAGDVIVIAPSGFDAREAERVTVTAVSGRSVSFMPALRHRHFGETQTYGGQVLDTRAAVGLLSRTIVVQGAADSDLSNFGGHVMVMPGAFARVAGVEFRRMGQTGHIGRYPLHWHLVDREPLRGVSGSGQYAVGNSFDGGFQRAIVLHGTSGVRVERNVAYLIPNHAIVAAEDGDEEDNVLRDNLVVLTRPALNREMAFPTFATSGPNAGETIQSERKASAFWSRNVNHVFTGNVAAGVVGGNGFFFDNHVRYDPALSVTTPFAVQRPARRIEFSGNVAHSICGVHKDWTEATFWTASSGGWSYSIYEGASHFMGLFVFKAVRNTTTQRPELLFSRFTAYKTCGSGAWLETSGETLVDSIVADSFKGVDARNGPAVLRSVIVGPTANDIGGRAPNHYGVLFNDFLGSSLRVEDTAFHNVFGGVVHLTDDMVLSRGQFARITLVNSPALSGSGDLRGGGLGWFLDADGTLTGQGQPTRISLNPLGAHSLRVTIPIGNAGATRPMYLTPH